MSKRREAAAIMLAVCIFLTITCGLGGLLLPQRPNFGATWGRFLQEERNSLDVLFFGSSVVYCDVVPAVVWQESGLTSYVMAGPEQTLAITCRYVREACKTQSPQAVVVELSGLFFDRYPEAMKPNLLYMPWGAERIGATLQGAAPEDWPELFFPLFASHDRVYSATWEDISSHLRPQADDYAGYTLMDEAHPISRRPDREMDTDSDTFRENLAYLREISDFCAQRDIQLILYLGPAYCTMAQDALDELRAGAAEIPGAAFFDCNTEAWPQFDPWHQWYDALHLNVAGAVPFSRRLGQELKALGLEGRHSAYSALWQERYELVTAEYEAILSSGNS